MTLALSAVFGAGVLTLATPCVLPLIPIYLALLAGHGQARGGAARLGLFLSTLAFGAGLVLVFVAMGLTATSLGGLLAEHRTQLTLVGGLVIFLFGLKFLGVLQLGWLERERRLDDNKLRTRFHLLNAAAMGVVFGLGWTPCIGPILGSVLTYTAASTSDPWRGAAYLAAYGLGLVAPLLLLALFADAARAVVQRVSRWLPVLEKVSGGLMLAAGTYLMLSVASPPSPTVTPTDVPRAAVTVDPPLGAASSRPRMVQFTSPDCSICRQMIPTVGVIERDCDGRQVDVVKVDVTQPQNRRLASRYRVRGVPTFVFFDRNGGEVARLVGYQTLGSLRQSLSALVGEQCAGLGPFTPEAAGRCEGSGATCGG